MTWRISKFGRQYGRAEPSSGSPPLRNPKRRDGCSAVSGRRSKALRRGGKRRPRPRRNSRAAETDRDAIVETIEITGDLGSHAVEALRLEIQRLARRRGLDVTAIRLEAHAEEPARRPSDG